MGGYRSPLTASRCALIAGYTHKLNKMASMGDIGIIGVDRAKNEFQAWRGADGLLVLFRTKPSSPQVIRFAVSRI